MRFSLFSVLALLLLTGCDEVVPKKQPSEIIQENPLPVEPKDSVVEPQQEPLVYRTDAPPVSSSTVVIESSASVITSSAVAVKRKPKKVVDSARTVKKDTVVVVEEPKVCVIVPAGMVCDMRDGKMYRTVKIGSQLWLAQNLNHRTEGSWCYNNRTETCETIGRLYNWAAAMDLPHEYLDKNAGQLVTGKHRGVCMEGWHIPSEAEMKTLVAYVENHNAELEGEVESVGTSLKSEKGWANCEVGEEGCVAPTDRYGFGALPAGRRHADGSFNDVGYDSGFWISAESSNGIHAPYWDLYYSSDKFWGSYSNRKKVAYSVRCIKD